MAKKEKKKSGFWSDFRKFIMRGNVLDLAVAVVVGGASTRSYRDSLPTLSTPSSVYS